MIYDCQIIRCLFNLTAEQRQYSLGIVVLHCCLVKGIKQAYAVAVHERDVAQRFVGSGSEGTHGIAHTLCQTLHHSLAVLPVVIFDSNTRLSWLIRNIEGNLELRHIQLHRLVGQHLLSAYAVIAQHTHLVGKHNVGLETEVGSNTCERIVLVGKGLVKGLLTLMQEILHALRTYLGRERKGVHEHTHRIGHFQVVATIGDGGDAYMVISRET